MKTLNKVRPGFSPIAVTGTFFLSLFISIQVVAQHVSDSDLSNTAGTNKNWLFSGWLIGLLIALIIVLFIAFRRRKNRTGKTFSNEERPG